MKLLKGVQTLQKSLVHPVVTIGNFDGVHLGHQKIIGLAIEKARARGGTAVVFTFRPHPQIALNPAAQVQLLSTYDEKLELLAAQGPKDVPYYVVEEPFSREFSTIPPEQFFTDVLLRQISAEAVIVGYDFAFGKGRTGHLEMLEGLCGKAGVDLSVVPPQKIGNEVVSSSRIRQHLLAGEMPSASRLLGRPFSYAGVVIRGEGRGKKLGFPTANLKLENKLALPWGVYATWAIVKGESVRIPSVTNVGVRPTFQMDGVELPALVETHLLDVSQDIYGRTLEVQFISRLREERKFDGIEALKSQISIDAGNARIALDNNCHSGDNLI